MEPMKPSGPIISVNDYDKDDDPHCGCETCNTPWGAQVLPLLVLAGRAQPPAPTQVTRPDPGDDPALQGTHLRVVPAADQ
jgi:hypothetical protein